MNKIIKIILYSLFLCTLTASAKVALLPVNDSAGYVARLLINEVPFPGEHGYISEKDTMAAMRALLFVLDSRINQVPAGYRRSEVAAVDSDNVLDVITAGGIRGQMDGFYYNRGQLAMASRVSARINNLLKIANQGTPGRFASLIRYGQRMATDYVARGVIHQPDIFIGISTIPPRQVTGRAYGWMTDRDYYNPGGCFVKIPNHMKGRLGGNRFYTLARRASSKSVKKSSGGGSIIAIPKSEGR